MIRADYHRRITDRRPSLTQRVLTRVLFVAAVWAFVWMWTGAV